MRRPRRTATTCGSRSGTTNTSSGERQDADVQPHARLGGSAGDAGCGHLRTAERPRVLVGGLGMGFTLRAALDLLPARTPSSRWRSWCRRWSNGTAAPWPVAGHPLKDTRVRVDRNDVGFTLRANPGRFDAVLLDVDNGPGVHREANHRPLRQSPAWPRRTLRFRAKAYSRSGRRGKTGNSSSACAITASSRTPSACAPASRRAAPTTRSSWGSSGISCPEARRCESVAPAGAPGSRRRARRGRSQRRRRRRAAGSSWR